MIPNLTCPDENKLAKLQFESQIIITIDNIYIFFKNFNLSIWTSKLEINLSGIKIYSSQRSRRVLLVILCFCWSPINKPKDTLLNLLFIYQLCQKLQPFLIYLQLSKTRNQNQIIAAQFINWGTSVIDASLNGCPTLTNLMGS